MTHPITFFYGLTKVLPTQGRSEALVCLLTSKFLCSYRPAGSDSSEQALKSSTVNKLLDWVSLGLRAESFRVTATNPLRGKVKRGKILKWKPKRIQDKIKTQSTSHMAGMFILLWTTDGNEAACPWARSARWKRRSRQGIWRAVRKSKRTCWQRLKQIPQA